MERRRFLSLSDDLKLQSSLPVWDFSQLLHNSRLAHAFSRAAYAKCPDFVHQRRRPSLRHCAAPSQFRFLGSLRSKFIPPAITLFSLIVVQEDCAPYPGRLFVGGWGDKKKKKSGGFKLLFPLYLGMGSGASSHQLFPSFESVLENKSH